MSPVSTEDIINIIHKLQLIELTVSQLEVNIEINASLENELTQPMPQRTTSMHLSKKLAPWNCLGAKPENKTLTRQLNPHLDDTAWPALS